MPQDYHVEEVRLDTVYTVEYQGDPTNPVWYPTDPGAEPFYIRRVTVHGNEMCIENLPFLDLQLRNALKEKLNVKPN